MRALIVSLAIWMSPAVVWGQNTHDGQLAPGLVNPGAIEQPAWFKTSFLDIGEDVAEARKAGRRVMLYFYQDGCPYCKKLIQENFSDPALVALTRSHFDVIAINIWGDREVTLADGRTLSEKSFAEALKVMFTPTLLFLNETAGAAFRVNGYYPPAKFQAALNYVGTRQERLMPFADFLSRQQTEGTSAGTTDNPRFRLPDRNLSGRPKPLLVLFEEQPCADCEELHRDILQRPASRVLLERFDVVVLDRRSSDRVTTPAGSELAVSEWARQLNITHTPSLVFFSREGSEVFRTEAYFKAFHLQSSMEYVASGAYRHQPNFQRFVQERGDRLRAQGEPVELMR